MIKNRRALILNADAMPLCTCDWTRAIVMVMQGSMIVLERAREQDGSVVMVRSAGGLEFELPSVLMRSRYVSWDKRLRYSRYNVFQRDGYTCQYCNSADGALTIDHVRPKSKIRAGEGVLWFNRVTACEKCNGQKANRSIEQMRGERTWNGRPFKLLKEPGLPDRPAVSRFIRRISRKNLEWLDYIPGWELAATRLGKEWLVKAHAEWNAERDMDR